jgi:DNA-binding CsgD family transcriptional regulator
LPASIGRMLSARIREIPYLRPWAGERDRVTFAAMLVGRERECAQLDALINRIRAGGSAALVITGEAGIGKTSLLEYAACQADGLRVLRAQGAESEQNLPFAGLAALVGPVMGRLDALPARQRAALAGALAVGPEAPAEPFVICAATLSVLAAAAAERPVLAVVDDAHWLDAASAQAVEFTARRLGTEGIGLVVAVRDGAASSFDPSRIDVVTVTGLDRAAAGNLLARTGRPIAAQVAGQLAQGVGGNPLALLELSATLTDGQLSGLTSLPEPLPVAAALRRVFTLRLDAAGPAARRLLVLAAADGTAELATLQRAGRQLSFDMGGLQAAEDAGLIRLGEGRVDFTHPLLRSAAYHTAPPADRRAAHRALAEAADPGQDPIRRAWHLAAAAIGPDETVAESLDLAAGTARSRNAYAAASRAHQRAAELTADPARQVSRTMAAGQAAHLAGDVNTAARLLTQAADLTADPCIRADAQAMRAHATLWAMPPLRHYRQLVAEADAVLPFDPQRAATLLALATGCCFMTSQLDLALETATRAASLCHRADGIPWLLTQAWLADATILTGGRRTGRQLIVGILTHPDITAPDPVVHHLRMLCGQALIWCEDYGPAADLLRSSVDEGRAQGRVADLTYGLAACSELYFRTGEWAQAYADATEAAELGADFATTSSLCYALVCTARIEAAMGAAQACHAHVDQALTLAGPAGIESIKVYAAAALGLLELGLGHYQQAAAELTRTASLVIRFGLSDLAVVQWRPDYIESLAGAGRISDAQEQLALLEAEASATGSPWAKAAVSRCHGLLQDTPQRAIDEFEQAVTIAETQESAFERARARLCLGQALRRARRRSAARFQLEQAQSIFEILGAQPWTGRAAAELEATGITAAPRHSAVQARLTSQELRVATQVAEGLTNQEVAARLFLSPKTIEVHLGHIYNKLGVHSRTSLARLITSGAVPQMTAQPGLESTKRT